ncbi:MAG TPA: hypothetical protein VHE35_04640 [Kofleriaceae bacterium]|nr:hypothetical protein [Kofleriaceae bacterium]
MAAQRERAARSADDARDGIVRGGRAPAPARATARANGKGLVLALAFAALAALLVAAPHAARAARPKRYYFALVEVKAADGVTVDPAVVDAIRTQAQKVLATHPQLVASLTDPPDDTAGMPVWRKYLARQKIDGAYRVNIEVNSYEETVEDMDPGDRVELRLTIRLGLRMFGEVIPVRTMAFTGDGGSTVKADMGKKVRDKDRAFNLDTAIEQAVNDALAASLHKLETTAPAKK